MSLKKLQDKHASVKFFLIVFQSCLCKQSKKKMANHFTYARLVKKLIWDKSERGEIC